MRNVSIRTPEQTRMDAATSRDEAGASAVEYGLLIALIAGVIITVVIVLGNTTSGAYDSMNGNFW